MCAEGQIVAEWIDELERQVAELAACGRTVHLDLSLVTFVGPRGLRMLRRLLTLTDVTAVCPPLIRGLLAEHHEES